MKHHIFPLLALLALLLAPAGALGETHRRYVANPVETDRLHLRSAPQQSAQSLGRFYNGTSVEVLSEKNGFCHVRIGTGEGAIEGYMRGEYLSDVPVPAALPAASINARGAQTGVTLRQSPDEGAAAVAFYRDTTQCDILGDIGEDWVYVRHDASQTCGYAPVADLVRLSAQRAIPEEARSACVFHPEDQPVHLRAAPGTASRSLGRFYPGTPVSILHEEEDGWMLVRVQPDGPESGWLFGYIRSRFLRQNQWLPSSACYATLTENVSILQKPAPGAPHIGTLCKGARIVPQAVTDEYAYVAFSQDIGGYVPLRALSFSQDVSGDPCERLSGAQGLCVVSMPIAGTRLPAYATCEAYYPLSRVNGSVSYASGFAQGDCLILLADLGEWAQVFDGYDASFVRADCLNMLKTGPIFEKGVSLVPGAYTAGEGTLDEGFYVYTAPAGTDGLLRIEGDGFTREYAPTGPASYAFYLPPGARLTFSGEGSLVQNLNKTFYDSPFSQDYASGRYLAGACFSVDSFWVMPREGAQESYMVITTFEQDAAAQEPERIPIQPAGEDGSPQQTLFAPAGCFVEFVGCVFGVNG